MCTKVYVYPRMCLILTHLLLYSYIGMDLVLNPINLYRIILSTTRIMSPIADHKSVQFISETGYLASFTPTPAPTFLTPTLAPAHNTALTEQVHTKDNNNDNNNEYKKGLVKTVSFKQQNIHQQQLQLQSHWSHQHRHTTTGTDGEEEEEEAGLSVEEWRNFTALGMYEYVYCLNYMHV